MSTNRLMIVAVGIIVALSLLMVYRYTVHFAPEGEAPGATADAPAQRAPSQIQDY